MYTEGYLGPSFLHLGYNKSLMRIKNDHFTMAPTGNQLYDSLTMYESRALHGWPSF